MHKTCRPALLATLVIAASCRTVVESSALDGTGASSGVVYYTPKQLVRLTLKPAENDAVDIELEPAEPVPDSEHRFTAWPNFNAFASDDVTIETTGSGLLQSVSVTSAEESGLILVKLAEIAKEVAKVAAAFPAARVAVGQTQPVVLEFDPEQLAESRVEIAGYGLTLSASRVSSRPGDGDAKWCPPTKEEACDGVVYRRSEIYRFEVAATEGGELLLTQHLALPTGEFAVVPLRAAPFVETKYEVKFDRGLLSSVTSDRPGPVLGALSVIPDALKEIASIPAELIQLKIDYSKAEGDVLEQNQRILELQSQLLEARRQLDEQLRNGGTGSGDGF